MLDLADPQTKYIFQASRTEDRIRLSLLGWKELSRSSSPSHCPPEVLASFLPELHKLNADHFGSSAGIARTLSLLGAAIRSGDPAIAWDAFLALAERPGENFGTWAI
jgi:hypothetical protein